MKGNKRMAKLALIETRPHPSGSFIPYQATPGLCKSVYFSASHSQNLYRVRHPSSSFSTVKKSLFTSFCSCFFQRVFAFVCDNDNDCLARLCWLRKEKKEKGRKEKKKEKKGVDCGRFSLGLIKFEPSDR